MLEENSIPSVHIYRMGINFKRTAEILFEIKPGDFDWVYPYITNASFSIELFLKSCLAKEYWENIFEDEILGEIKKLERVDVKDQDKIHSLPDLFSRLPKNYKDKIKVKYQSTSMFKEYNKVGGLLKKLDGLFEKSRYGYANQDSFNLELSIIINTASFFEKIIPELNDLNK